LLLRTGGLQPEQFFKISRSCLRNWIFASKSDHSLGEAQIFFRHHNSVPRCAVIHGFSVDIPTAHLLADICWAIPYQAMINFATFFPASARFSAIRTAFLPGIRPSAFSPKVDLLYAVNAPKRHECAPVPKFGTGFQTLAMLRVKYNKNWARSIQD